MCKMAGFVVCFLFFLPLHSFYCTKELHHFITACVFGGLIRKYSMGAFTFFFLSKCCFSIPVFELDRYFIKIEKLLVVAGN